MALMIVAAMLSSGGFAKHAHLWSAHSHGSCGGGEPGFTSDLLGSTTTINLLQGLGRWNGAGFDAAISSLFASHGGQDATSESFYVLFNLGESEIDHDEAIEWVEANLVPAPGALALLAAGVLAGRRRR